MPTTEITARSAEAVLDKAIAQARGLRIEDEVARLRADDALRRIAAEQARGREGARGVRSWRWPLGLALAAAAGAAVAIAVPRLRAPADDASLAEAPIVGIGPRVAIVASTGARYTVIVATEDRTDITVASGAVTARLYAGAAPHRLRLVADGLEATATGTIYTVVAPDSGSPYAVVHEGKIELRDRTGDHAVMSGQSWPAVARQGAGGNAASAITRVAEAAARRLAHHTLAAATAPPAPPQGSPTTAPDSPSIAPDSPGSAADTASSKPGADTDTASRSPTADTASSTPSADTASRTPKPDAASRTPGGTAGSAAGSTAAGPPDERWRRARQLRGQGHPREALAILDQLANSGDAVWSPIAVAEAMRIEGSVIGEPREVIRLGDAFLARYPKHALVREVTELVCRAHRALGETQLPSACALRGE